MDVKEWKDLGTNVIEKAGKLFPDNDIDMASTLTLK